MPLYVLYPTQADGLCNTFVTVELASDEAVAVRAAETLADHPSAAAVVVYCGAQKVLTRWRRSAAPFVADRGPRVLELAGAER